MFRILISACCFLILMTTSFGQNQLDPNSRDSILSVQKDNSALIESTFPIQIISYEVIRNSGARTLADLLDDQLGIIVNGLNLNHGKDKIVYMQGAEAEYTLILIDGVPITDPSGLNGVYDLRYIPMTMIERIEILKGNQSVSYGSDALSGVINIITKKQSKDIEASLAGSYGSFETLKGTGYLSARNDNINYNLGFNIDKSAGVSESLDPLDRDTFDLDRFFRFGAIANLNFKITSNLDAEIFTNYTNWYSAYDSGSFLDGNNDFDAEMIRAGLKVSNKLQNGKLILQADITNTERNFDTPFGFTQFNGISKRLELYRNHKISESFNLLYGFQNLHSIAKNGGRLNDFKANSSGGYAKLFYKFSNFNFDLGSRITYNNLYQWQPSLALGLSYLIKNRIKLHSYFSTGYKEPTLYQFYGLLGGNENLLPHRSNSLDLGAQVLGDKSSLSVNYFLRRIEGHVVFSSDLVFDNIDRSFSHGLEIESKVELTNWLEFLLQIVVMDSNREREVEPNTYLEVFSNFRRPANQVDFGLILNHNKKWYMDLRGRWVSERNDFIAPANLVPLDPYFLLNASLSYHVRDNLSLFCHAKNITNSNFVEVNGFTNLGRNLMLGARIDY